MCACLTDGWQPARDYIHLNVVLHANHMRLSLLLVSGFLLAAAFGPLPADAVPVVLIVPSDGTAVTVLLPAGTYSIIADGTYSYHDGPQCVDACYADADYSWNPPPEGSCYDWPGDIHDLLVNGMSPWGQSCDSNGHRYTTLWSCAEQCTLSFHIYDDWYGDNSGHLTVTIDGEIVPPATQVLEVPSDGSTVTATLPPGVYLLTSSGTYSYAYGPQCVNACYADADYSWNPLPEGPCYDWPGDLHDLLVGGVSPWTQPCDPNDHTHAVPWACPAGCTLSFRIHDDEYGDNSGHLTVTILSI